MDSTDEDNAVPEPKRGCNCHECREARGQQVAYDGPPTLDPRNQPPLPIAPVVAPPTFYSSADDVVVGPHGETRAQAREKLLDALTDFSELIRTAQDKGEISGKDAYRLRLQIHRERCALLGLSYANGVTW